jgi:GAF domain-containing protein
MRDRSDHEKLRRVLDLERALGSESDAERVLRVVLDQARVITGARYAALGVLDEDRAELDRFLAAGVDADTERTIGRPPRGRGILGLLVADPRPLRLADISRHPDSYGFPAGHPPMRTFLGVPITIDGRPVGNLYLAEKEGGCEFTEADERAAIRLAAIAAAAIERERA